MSETSQLNSRSNENHVSITEAQLILLADESAQRAIDKLYAEIGSSVVKKASLLVGAILAAATAWLTGLLHIGPIK
tara:strand:+ start:143 stop:370 length:228 start_codon:yes stop_codon:yes gene_type:complete